MRAHLGKIGDRVRYCPDEFEVPDPPLKNGLGTIIQLERVLVKAGGRVYDLPASKLEVVDGQANDSG